MPKVSSGASEFAEKYRYLRLLRVILSSYITGTNKNLKCIVHLHVAFSVIHKCSITSLAWTLLSNVFRKLVLQPDKVKFLKLMLSTFMRYVRCSLQKSFSSATNCSPSHFGKQACRKLGSSQLTTSEIKTEIKYNNI